jgi:hypothetical protein
VVTDHVGHFVPQKHLRAFEDPASPGLIWTYPRGEEPRLASIDKVAQAPGFYDANVETDLGRLIESPANPFLDALRRGEDVDADGRNRVALYLATMIKRVPRGRERGKALIPSTLQNVVEALRAELLSLAAGDPARLERWLVKLEAVHAEYLTNPPPQVLDQLKVPWPSPEMVEVIRRMHWRLLVAAAPEIFVTSDNPLFYFEGWGLGRPESEFCFPLSPTHCLHGCHQPTPGGRLDLRPADRALVHEVNRRMANDATKLLFASKRLKWPATLLRKGRNHYLSAIRWS